MSNQKVRNSSSVTKAESDARAWYVAGGKAVSPSAQRMFRALEQCRGREGLASCPSLCGSSPRLLRFRRWAADTSSPSYTCSTWTHSQRTLRRSYFSSPIRERVPPLPPPHAHTLSLSLIHSISFSDCLEGPSHRVIHLQFHFIPVLWTQTGWRESNT